MNKYPDPSRQDEPEFKEMVPDLEFPIDPNFDSVPPRIDPQLMLERFLETMPWRSARPEEQKWRRESKVDVEFIL
jgi:hypothetical protein